MRKTVLFLAAALTLVAADKPDLSGKWVLNVQKSSFGKRPAPISMDLQVERKGDGFHSKLTSTDGTGNGAVTEGDWFLDGKVHTVPGEKWTQMSKWDGNVLVAENKSAEDAFEEHLRLTACVDGKHATETRTVKDQQGTYTSTLVWDRR